MTSFISAGKELIHSFREINISSMMTMADDLEDYYSVWIILNILWFPVEPSCIFYNRNLNISSKQSSHITRGFNTIKWINVVLSVCLANG